MIRRLLAIDDELNWLDNFRRWIPGSLVEQHSASTTEEAAFYLRRYHYDLVLLDLSMNISDHGDRANQGIQKYLSTRSEGSAYFIVSGTAEVEDAINAAYTLNASWISLKQELDPEVLRDRIQKVLAENSYQSSKFVADDRTKLVGDVFLETKLITTLGIGAQAFTQMLDTVLSKISPLAIHIYRQQLDIRNSTVLGLVWSRQRGKALSISFAKVSVTPEEQTRELADWLGYADREPELEERVFYKKVRVQCFAEPNISDEHFGLPKI